MLGVILRDDGLRDALNDPVTMKRNVVRQLLYKSNVKLNRLFIILKGYQRIEPDDSVSRGCPNK